MTFSQLLTLLSSPRVQYLRWKDEDVYKTYIKLISEHNLDPDNQERELDSSVAQLVEKFVAQINEKFGITLTPEELGKTA